MDFHDNPLTAHPFQKGAIEFNFAKLFSIVLIIFLSYVTILNSDYLRADTWFGKSKVELIAENTQLATDLKQAEAVNGDLVSQVELKEDIADIKEDVRETLKEVVTERNETITVIKKETNKKIQVIQAKKDIPEAEKDDAVLTELLAGMQSAYDQLPAGKVKA